MTRLFFTLLILSWTASFGQSATNIKNKADTFQNNLIKNNINTLLDYTLECVGSDRIDTCNFFDAHYIFWKQNDQTFLQRIDGCNIYQTISLDTTNNPLTFYIAQKKKIDHEIIYPPTYVQSQHGDTGTLISQSIDHTCYYEMTFITKTKKVIKSISDYDLTFKTFDNGRKNMYYNYNQQTQLKRFIDLITHFLKQMDTDKKFEVQ